MASTFSVWYKVRGVLNGKIEESGDLFDPQTIATSDDTISTEVINIAATSGVTVTLPTVTTAAVLYAFVPSGTAHIVWASSGGDADNSAAVVPANMPFFLYSNSLPYQNTTANRYDETAAAIDTVKIYNPGGAAIKVEKFIIG